MNISKKILDEIEILCGYYEIETYENSIEICFLNNFDEHIEAIDENRKIIKKHLIKKYPKYEYSFHFMQRKVNGDYTVRNYAFLLIHEKNKML